MSYDDYLTNFWGKVPDAGGVHSVKPTTEIMNHLSISTSIAHDLSMSPSLILTRLLPTMQLRTKTVLDYHSAYMNRRHNIICTKASYPEQFSLIWGHCVTWWRPGARGWTRCPPTGCRGSPPSRGCLRTLAWGKRNVKCFLIIDYPRFQTLSQSTFRS